MKELLELIRICHKPRTSDEAAAAHLFQPHQSLAGWVILYREVPGSKTPSPNTGSRQVLRFLPLEHRRRTLLECIQVVFVRLKNHSDHLTSKQMDRLATGLPRHIKGQQTLQRLRRHLHHPAHVLLLFVLLMQQEIHPFLRPVFMVRRPVLQSRTLTEQMKGDNLRIFEKHCITTASRIRLLVLPVALAHDPLLRRTSAEPAFGEGQVPHEWMRRWHLPHLLLETAAFRGNQPLAIRVVLDEQMIQRETHLVPELQIHLKVESGPMHLTLPRGT